MPAVSDQGHNVDLLIVPEDVAEVAVVNLGATSVVDDVVDVLDVVLLECDAQLVHRTAEVVDAEFAIAGLVIHAHDRKSVNFGATFAELALDTDQKLEELSRLLLNGFLFLLLSSFFRELFLLSEEVLFPLHAPEVLLGGAGPALATSFVQAFPLKTVKGLVLLLKAAPFLLLEAISLLLSSLSTLIQFGLTLGRSALLEHDAGKDTVHAGLLSAGDGFQNLGVVHDAVVLVVPAL